MFFCFFIELEFLVVVQWVVAAIYKSQSPYALLGFTACDLPAITMFSIVSFGIKLTLFISWNFKISLTSPWEFQRFQKTNSVILTHVLLINMRLLVLIILSKWQSLDKYDLYYAGSEFLYSLHLKIPPKIDSEQR